MENMYESLLLLLYLVPGGKMTFADFLEVIHAHNQVEKIPDEILDAFKANDPGKKGVIPARDLKNILGRWGEKLSPKESTSICIYHIIIFSDFCSMLCISVKAYADGS